MSKNSCKVQNEHFSKTKIGILDDTFINLLKK